MATNRVRSTSYCRGIIPPYKAIPIRHGSQPNRTLPDCSDSYPRGCPAVVSSSQPGLRLDIAPWCGFAPHCDQFVCGKIVVVTAESICAFMDSGFEAGPSGSAMCQSSVDFLDY